MTGLEITYFVIALIIMLAGLIGTVLPVIPGPPIIFLAALGYAALTGFNPINGHILAILGILAGSALLLDYVASAFGIKKMGGSYFGVLGSFIGMIAGLIIGGGTIIGFIIGAFVGAVLFEMIIGKKSKVALKAGIGSFIGFILGGVVKFSLAAVMIGIFFWKVLIE